MTTSGTRYHLVPDEALGTSTLESQTATSPPKPPVGGPSNLQSAPSEVASSKNSPSEPSLEELEDLKAAISIRETELSNVRIKLAATERELSLLLERIEQTIPPAARAASLPPVSAPSGPPLAAPTWPAPRPTSVETSPAPPLPSSGLSAPPLPLINASGPPLPLVNASASPLPFAASGPPLPLVNASAPPLPFAASGPPLPLVNASAPPLPRSAVSAPPLPAVSAPPGAASVPARAATPAASHAPSSTRPLETSAQRAVALSNPLPVADLHKNTDQEPTARFPKPRVSQFMQESSTLRGVVLRPDPRESIAPSSGPNSRNDRRSRPRYACEFELAFMDEAQFFAGLSLDISEGGLFVATYNVLPIGTKLGLRFELPDGTEVEARGEVRWIRRAALEGDRPGLGIAFTSLPDGALEKIVAYCSKRPPLYVDDV